MFRDVGRDDTRYPPPPPSSHCPPPARSTAPPPHPPTPTITAERVRACRACVRGPRRGRHIVPGLYSRRSPAPSLAPRQPPTTRVSQSTPTAPTMSATNHQPPTTDHQPPATNHRTRLSTAALVSAHASTAPMLDSASACSCCCRCRTPIHGPGGPPPPGAADAGPPKPPLPPPSSSPSRCSRWRALARTSTSTRASSVRVLPVPGGPWEG